MPFHRQLTAKQMSMTALAIWCCSLPLTGLVLYSEQKHLTGFEILAMGWLSPLVLNFAWFANVLFLYSIYRLRSGGVPNKSAKFSALLSLDTVRFSQFVLHEGGATTPIYGYGWGAVLWFVSIFVMLVAVGVRRRETNNESNPQDLHEWFQPLGLVLLLVTLGTALYFAVHDRMAANPSESLRLASIAFKRGKVCGAPEPSVINPIQNVSGPVEVVVEKNGLNNAVYPFTQVKDLLEWGIPTVRIGNNDYSYDKTARDGLLFSEPANNATTAVLFVNESYKRSIRAKLVETSTNRTVFDQTWKREDHPGDAAYYCPDYNSFPRDNEQPRQLLMQALNLHASQSKTREIVQEPKIFDRVEGTITERKEGGITRATKIARWKEMNPDSKAWVPYPEINNTNCPSDIGWNGNNYDTRLNTGWPFMVRGKSFYLQHRDRYNATCEGDFVFIYAGSAQNGKYYLNIEKRDLQDFRQVWGLIVVTPGVSPSMRDDVLKVQSVQRSTATVTINLVNEDSGQLVSIQAPLHDK